MLIDIALGCEVEPDSGRSECGLVLAALSEYRNSVKQNRHEYGDDTDGILAHIDSIALLVRDAMLTALESLEPLAVPTATNVYKTVYAIRTKAGEGRAE